MDWARHGERVVGRGMEEGGRRREEEK